jgi:vacuole morphology and inheritance protein 14
VKDIVSESAASYVSMVQPNAENVAGSEATKGIDPYVGIPTAFSLSRFIPLLQERIHVLNPFTRTFLVNWITLLDSIPDLELVSYLPSFLGGLFNFLSDPIQDVHQATQVLLERFLTEIKKIARIKKGITESKKSQADGELKGSNESVRSDKSERSDPRSSGAGEQDREQDSDVAIDDGTSDESGSSTDDDKSTSGEDTWISGQDVQINHRQILDILLNLLNISSGKSMDGQLELNADNVAEQETQITVLRWIDSFFEICPEDLLPFVPRLLEQVLPAMSNEVEQVRQAANRVNTSLMDFIMSLSEDQSKSIPATAKESNDQERRNSVLSAKQPRADSGAQSTDARMPNASVPSTAQKPVLPLGEVAELDYEESVGALTLQFLNKNEATRVAALAWLIMLHKKSPRKVRFLPVYIILTLC